MLEQRINKRALSAWLSYGSGLQAFQHLILTFVFSNYFIQHVAIDPIQGTKQWGMTLTIASLLKVLFGPLVGAFVDKKGHIHIWIAVLTALLSMSALLFWFIYPHPSSVLYALTCVLLASFFCDISYIFFNTLLLSFCPPQLYGRVSGLGLAIGSLSSILIFTLFIVIQKILPNLDADSFENIRICGPYIAGWVILLSIPIILMSMQLPRSVKKTTPLKSLLQTMKNMKTNYPDLTLFLLARSIFIIGVLIIMGFGGVYASSVYHLNMQEILLFGISLNIASAVGALLMGYIDDKISTTTSLMITLSLMSILVFFASLTTTLWTFLVFSISAGAFIGASFSTGRALMAILTPVGKEYEMFGFYLLSSRIFAFIAPASFTGMTYLFGMWAGLMVVVFYLITGIYLLSKIDKKIIYPFAVKKNQ